MFEIKGKYTTAKIFIDNVDQETLSQIYEMMNCPAFTNPISIMPDTHKGNGSVIGFTMKMTQKIIPVVIGVDIACGITSLNVGRHLFFNGKDSLKELDDFIRKNIPFGNEVHKESLIKKETLLWDQVRYSNPILEKILNDNFSFDLKNYKFENHNVKWFERKCKEIGIGEDRALKSIGTVGGGNHFIEVGKDSNKNIWITVHSGSRNFGKKICDYWQKKAKNVNLQNEIKELVNNTKQEHRHLLELNIKKLKEEKQKIRNLEWLDEEDIPGYLNDMIFCHHYALTNREYILKKICKFLEYDPLGNFVNCTHNYIDLNDYIIRKGAIRAHKDERLLIPLNMRDGILIGKGKGNSEWNYSAPHGAGRILSRRKAKEVLSLENFSNEMEGIYSSSINNYTIDEAPMAYKDSKVIEDAIHDNVEIIDKIIPIMNIKEDGLGRYNFEKEKQ